MRFVHNFHASEAAGILAPNLRWPSFSVGSFFSRFIGFDISRRPTTDGADSGVAAVSKGEL